MPLKTASCVLGVWGLMKDKVYARYPANMDELKHIIMEEFALLDTNLDLCSRTCYASETCPSISRKVVGTLKTSHLQAFL